MATEIPTELIRAREAMGLNQSQLALRLGVTRAAVCNWESGLRAPRRSQLILMAATFIQPIEVVESWFEREPIAAAGGK